MYRCAFIAVTTLTLSLAAAAQVHRPFPADALRGDLVVQQTPEALIDQRPVRLSPGARIRGDNNLLLLPASISGQKLVVHYTLDGFGMVKDVWVLNPLELANKPWPRTPQEAATWAFDPASQTWTRR